MQNNLSFKVLAVVTLSLASLSLANGAAAEEGTFTTTQCGSGRVEVCGELTTYRCEWSGRWTPWYTFPYMMYVPRYDCEVMLKDLLYKDSSPGETQTPDQ